MATPRSDGLSSADRKQIELFRAASPARRVGLARSLSASVIHLSRAAIRGRHPDLSEREVLLAFVALHYGRDLAERVRRYLAHQGQ